MVLRNRVLLHISQLRSFSSGADLLSFAQYVIMETKVIITSGRVKNKWEKSKSMEL